LVFIIHLSIFPLFSFFLLLLALLQCSRSLLLFLALASFVAALLFVFIFYLRHTSFCTVNFANILLAPPNCAFLATMTFCFYYFKKIPRLYLDLLL
jgi:hypothetical protein